MCIGELTLIEVSISKLFRSCKQIPVTDFFELHKMNIALDTDLATDTRMDVVQ